MTRGVAGWRGASLAWATAALCGLAHAGTVSMAPLLPGRFAAGSGVDATFLKIDDAWRGSGVLYDPLTDQLGSGVPIGRFPRGTGLWGLVDWHTAHFAPTPDLIQATWTGRVAQIGFGDAYYDQLFAPQWGAMPLPPLFAGDDTASQDNWTARFSGYLRISEAGVYNFGVLHDDGFSLTLAGGAGQSMTLSHDYLNPLSRMSFAQDLLLDVGLYAFALGAYERLEVGVVELAWRQGDGDWSRVPTAHLLSGEDLRPLPEPGTLALLALGLGGLIVARRVAA